MRYGYCISCKKKRSSKWHNARENWIEFCVSPEEQTRHQRKNKVCNDCYHRLNEQKTDPLVKEFGDGSDKPAPKIKKSKISGHGNKHIICFASPLPLTLLLTLVLQIGLFASRDYERHELVALYLGTTSGRCKGEFEKR